MSFRTTSSAPRFAGFVFFAARVIFFLDFTDKFDETGSDAEQACFTAARGFRFMLR
ncbi:MAG TPA: hypothetical protein VKV15_06695 [Bryobacteraceae bacterium]|nr:hypothetical protein [Bryobacteraceae bacterium]